MYSSEDSDTHMTVAETIEHYLKHPLSRHAGNEASGGDEVWQPQEETVQLDSNEPEDYGDCPIPNDRWADVPLSPENAAIISIRIKRVAFIRQEAWNLEDHLFRFDSSMRMKKNIEKNLYIFPDASFCQKTKRPTTFCYSCPFWMPSTRW